MQIGVYMGFARRPGDNRPLVELYDGALRHARQADDLGFDLVLPTLRNWGRDAVDSPKAKAASR